MGDARNYRLWTRTCLGATTEMTPAQVQAHVDTLVSAGMPLTFTVAEPGVQGVAVAGTHG
jgi:hypothetical protein